MNSAQGLMLCVDPGLRQFGVAVFQDGQLIAAETVKSKEKKARGMVAWKACYKALLMWTLDPSTGKSGHYDTLAYEMMELKENWRKGDRNDVLELVGVLGQVANISHDFSAGHVPSKWTKGRKKPPNQMRIWRHLTIAERSVFPPNMAAKVDRGRPGKWEHAIDAVGVGLFELGRLQRNLGM